MGQWSQIMITTDANKMAYTDENADYNCTMSFGYLVITVSLLQI